MDICGPRSLVNWLIKHLEDLIVKEQDTESILHVFAFQWKPEASPAQKKQAAADIAAFQGIIPGLMRVTVGTNLSPRHAGFTFGGVMEFDGFVSLEAYAKHPAHRSLLDWLSPLVVAMELDLAAPIRQGRPTKDAVTYR